MAEVAATEDEGGGSGGGITIAQHFRIFLEQPLPALDSPRATAVMAIDNRFQTRDVFALSIDPRQAMRADVLAILRGQPAQSWLGLAASDMFELPGTGERRLAVVMERPGGQRLWPSMTEPAEPIPERTLARFVVPNVADALQDLGNRRVAHGSIRPDNLFYMDKEQSQVVVGEGISGPPGFSQPVSFETVDRGFAHPLARGDGSPEGDLYSFGVTLLALLLGHDPADGRDDATLLAEKQIQGSFAALAGDVSASIISNQMRVLLRGLLADDFEQRWTPEQVLEWCENPRVNAKRLPALRRAPRPFVFNGMEFGYARPLPAAFAANRSEALAVLRDGSLAKWVRNELHDAAADERLEEAILGAGNDDDALISQVSMALDPQGPLRFRDLVAMPDGLGPLLLDAFANRDSNRLGTIAELLKSDLPQHWAERHGGPSTQISVMLRTLGEQAGYLREQAFGFGLERCLYELNPGLPCRSQLVAEDNVASVADLLVALDRAAARGIDEDNVVDRHIAAFVGSHNSRNTVLLKRLAKAGEDVAEGNLANLALLARLQEAEKSGPLRDLCAWWRGRLTPAIESFHSVIRRDVIAAHLESAAKTGQLVKMLQAVDGIAVREQDEDEYARAKREYAANDIEIEHLAGSDINRAEAAIGLGHQIAAGLGALMLTTSLVYFALAGMS
jgi:hypothetical protein